MPKPLSSPTGSIAIVAVLFLSGAVVLRTSTAHADDCLTAPNSSAPNGYHWYYHLDLNKQRKCWYLRAAGPPAQPASEQIPVASHNKATLPDAQISANNGIATPLPHIQMLAVKPQPAPAETTDEPVEQSAEEESTASSTPSASPRASTSMETNAQATGLAPVVRPDPSAAGVYKSREPTAALSVARTDSDQALGNATASNNAETNPRTGSPATTPVELFPIFALGLVVAGFLSRVVMKITTARRRRIIIDRPESYWIDDRQRHGWRDNPKHDGAIAEQGEFLDGLDRSLISNASDYSPHRPFKTNDQWSENAVGQNGASAANDESSERRDKLHQLRQDLDRLLRSPKAGMSWPVS
jgi:hypothetical protein